ncbi:MAG TPA: helix-hairpin-helix domain-containing protein [Anaerolineales bacterium]|nr:helix-hairpin-helix domain-containing protein [Anaerolineales bacterium]
MRAFKVFIFGLLYGWIFKIAFDRIYRENEMEDVRNENRSLREYIGSLESQLESKSLAARPVQRMDLQAEPKATPAPEPTTEPTTPPPGQEDVPVPPGTLGATEELKDDLKVIKGIGPAIERKLNNSGIFTFAALAQLSPKQLEEILGSQVRRLQDENDVILQAVRLAKNNPR